MLRRISLQSCWYSGWVARCICMSCCQTLNIYHRGWFRQDIIPWSWDDFPTSLKVWLETALRCLEHFWEGIVLQGAFTALPYAKKENSSFWRWHPQSNASLSPAIRKLPQLFPGQGPCPYTLFWMPHRCGRVRSIEVPEIVIMPAFMRCDL